MELQGRVYPDILASFSFILFYSISNGRHGRECMLCCFDAKSLRIYDENNIFWAIETFSNLPRLRFDILFDIRTFGWYMNIRFGLSIEPQIPVLDKNRELVRSPSYWNFTITSHTSSLAAKHEKWKTVFWSNQTGLLALRNASNTSGQALTFVPLCINDWSSKFMVIYTILVNYRVW